MLRDTNRKTSKNSGLQFHEHLIILTKQEVESLLSKLCSDLGFCLSPKVQARLINSPPRNPHRFSEVVMLAEGFELGSESGLYEQVFQYVLRAFETSSRNTG